MLVISRIQCRIEAIDRAKGPPSPLFWVLAWPRSVRPSGNGSAMACANDEFHSSLFLRAICGMRARDRDGLPTSSCVPRVAPLSFKGPPAAGRSETPPQVGRPAWDGP